MVIDTARARMLTIAATLALASCNGGATPEPGSEAVAGEIRSAVDTFLAGLNRHDGGPWLEQLSQVRRFAENDTVFPDAQTVANSVSTFLASASDVSMTWKDGPTVIALGPDAGVVVGTMHYEVTWTDGSTLSTDAHGTLVYQRVDGEWRVVVGHESYRIPGGNTTG